MSEEIWSAPCRGCGGGGQLCLDCWHPDLEDGYTREDTCTECQGPHPTPCHICKAAKEVMLVVVMPCPQASEMGCLQPVSDEYCNKYGEGVCELTRPLTVSEVKAWEHEHQHGWECLIEAGATFKGQPVQVRPKEVQ